MSKIDTQGMSGPADPNYKPSGKPQEHKPMMIHPRRLFTPEYVKEMKILINEVLDEREYERKLNGPYDMVEELGNINITPAMLDDAYAHHFISTATVGIDTSGEILS